MVGTTYAASCLHLLDAKLFSIWLVLPSSFGDLLTPDVCRDHQRSIPNANHTSPLGLQHLGHHLLAAGVDVLPCVKPAVATRRQASRVEIFQLLGVTCIRRAGVLYTSCSRPAMTWTAGRPAWSTPSVSWTLAGKFDARPHAV